VSPEQSIMRIVILLAITDEDVVSITFYYALHQSSIYIIIKFKPKLNKIQICDQVSPDRDLILNLYFLAFII
jgi:hypothetical protein